MRLRRRRALTLRTLLWLCGIVVLLAGLSIAGLLAIGRQFRRDFGGQVAEFTPREVFARAMGRPAPPGVSDIRAAGDFGLGGANVWLRFQATPQAIRILTRNAPRASTEWLDSATFPSPGYDQQKRRIGWNQVMQVRRPEAYDLTSRIGGTARFLLDDRPRGTAYVYYWTQ